jgi:hypothetical protein
LEPHVTTEASEMAQRPAGLVDDEVVKHEVDASRGAADYIALAANLPALCGAGAFPPE